MSRAACVAGEGFGMRLRVLLASALAGCLVGLMFVAVPGPAGAVVRRHWGLATDSYGARLYVCRMPEHTKLGTMWRHYVRVANHSRVRVVASVKVTRWVLHPSHNVVKETWVKSVPAGSATPVSSVKVWYQRASEGRFFDYVSFQVRRPFDGKVLKWEGLLPTGAPRVTYHRARCPGRARGRPRRRRAASSCARTCS